MYQGLAAVYDRLSSIDHGQWADFLEQVFQECHLPGKRVLDLACGTGDMCKQLVQRGYQPVGVDLSEEMLAMAENKLRNSGVSLFRADMRLLPELGKFEAIISLSDSFNYLADSDELTTVLKGLHRMEPELLIFDLNSPYYLGQVLGDNSFHHVEDDLAYIWENSYDQESAVCEMQLTFFIRDNNGSFQRFEECHVEKAFAMEEVLGVLTATGWRLLRVCDGYSANAPVEDSQRWLFIAVPG